MVRLIKQLFVRVREYFSKEDPQHWRPHFMSGVTCKECKTHFCVICDPTCWKCGSGKHLRSKQFHGSGLSLFDLSRQEPIDLTGTINPGPNKGVMD